MKIAITSDVDIENISGVSKNTLLIKDELIRQGHEVKLFIPKTKDSQEDTSNIVRVKSRQIKDMPPFYLSKILSPKMYKIFKKEKFDVIHLHSPLTMWALSYQMSLFFDIPLVYTYHTIIPDYLQYLGKVGDFRLTKGAVKYFEKATCNPCDLIISPSKKVKDYLENINIKTPIKIVPNGVQTKRFLDSQGGYLINSKISTYLDGNDKIILCVGRIDSEKDPLFCVNSMKHVVDKVPNAKLVFVGEGNLEKDVRNLAKELSIKDNILILGQVNYNDIPDVYKDGDIYITASTTENHSLAMVEAISSGLPVVAVDDPAFETNVKDNINGYMVKKDTKVFADHIVKILSNNDLQKEMSNNSIQLSKDFSLIEHVKNLVAVYKQVTGK